MRSSASLSKRALSIVLLLTLLVSTVAFAVTVNAAETDAVDTGADTYYLWGENSNSPDFNATTPTGTFTYDSTNGYYYYDLSGATGDYCFVVSTVSNSAASAVKSPAVSSAQSSGSYYLTAGNYHGYSCMHIWNPSGDAVRLYFTSTSSGLNAVAAGSSPTTAPTSAPTTAPTSSSDDDATTPVTPTTAPTTAPTTSTDARYVYCDNQAGWTSVYAYMWKNSGSSSNASWPGVKMTNLGDTIWRYEVTGDYDRIIFNAGSNSTQTSDLTYPGDGYIYDNSTGSWEIYDTSPLQVTSYTSDLSSPQYNGTGIELVATADGEGTVYYKFSAILGSNTQLIADYSTQNTATWTPQSAGTYTLVYDFLDAAGNTNQRTKTYVIEDGLSSVAPYIKTVTPNGGEIQRATAVNLDVSAGGGITGTNLLFYKYTVKDANGDIVNVPYYTLSNKYTFTPASTGAYTVTVYVQGSDNKVAERTYSYESVGSITPTTAPETVAPTEAPTEAPTDAPTVAPTAAPTAAPTVAPTEAPTDEPIATPLYGDADGDGEVTPIDATYIQRNEAGIPIPSPIIEENADVNGDGEVDILDVTLIQRYLAGIIEKFPIER